MALWVEALLVEEFERKCLACFQVALCLWLAAEDVSSQLPDPAAMPATAPHTPIIMDSKP